ncbi:hypothetical protein CLV45_1786 [Hymenobacter chitinivorans DSM 11115]|uniref:Uncharacterized protein n=1 Tax=Hymenobacter chitinivorans DSM 11115 TaxID=1121954 RepID=A0A2M9BQX8_9BACT|nr:hypothetical protein CLV45_1786 [Hymenobacter chitinivorans DSM 11115]
MYKTLLLVFWLILGTLPWASAAVLTSATPADRSWVQPLFKRAPKDKTRSGRYIHRPNYKRYKGPGNPNRGILALFS